MEPDGTEDYFHMMRVEPASTWANTWRIPASYDGKTVRLTVVLRGTYTHHYTEVSSVAQVETRNAGIVKQEADAFVSLADAMIYNMAGAKVLAVSKSDVITLPEGIYVAKSGPFAEKFIIRN